MRKRVYRAGLRKIMFATPRDIITGVEVDPSAFEGLDGAEAKRIAEDVAAGRRALIVVEPAPRPLDHFEAKPLIPREPESPLIDLLPLEVVLVDEDGKPIGDARFEARLPDGQVQKGQLDPDGFVRFDDVHPGTCTITFPELEYAVEVEQTEPLRS